MLPTVASASSSSPGLLPTPDAALASGGHTHRGGARCDEALLPGIALTLLRTPTAQLAVNGGSQHPDKRKAGGHGPTLADEIEHLLPTPTVQESHRSLWVDDRDRDGNPGQMLTSAIGQLLPTPLVSDGRPEGPADMRRNSPALRAVEHLLPTPNPFHLGNSETPHEWMERRAEVQERTGTRHGPALGVVALSVAEGAPPVQDGEGPRRVQLLPTPTGHSDSSLQGRDDLGAETRLLPTPRATDGAKGGPNQRGSSGDLMLPAAVQPERWGPYAEAIARWEDVTGATAPPATEPGKRGQPRLSAPFVEWMMGLPAGWVTDVPNVNRNGQLKALGNGVVPQQAAIAVAAILPGLPDHVLAALRGEQEAAL